LARQAGRIRVPLGFYSNLFVAYSFFLGFTAVDLKIPYNPAFCLFVSIIRFFTPLADVFLLALILYL
jgi:hypothetical protein